jgi:hypothetical protein
VDCHRVHACADWSGGRQPAYPGGLHTGVTRTFVFLLHFSSACVAIDALGRNDKDEHGGDDNNTTKTTIPPCNSTSRPRLVLVPRPLSSDPGKAPVPRRLEQPRSPIPVILTFTFALSLTRSLHTPSVVCACCSPTHIRRLLLSLYNPNNPSCIFHSTSTSAAAASYANSLLQITAGQALS